MSLNMMLLLMALFVLHSFLIPAIHCSIHNIETFYPNELTPTQLPELQASPAPAPVATSSTSNSKIVTAVAATASGTLIASFLICLSIKKCFKERRKNVVVTSTASGLDRTSVVPQVNVFERMEGNIKGIVVDEDGLDVVYWRKFQGNKNSNKDLQKEVLHLHSPKNKEENDHEGKISGGSIQETPLLRGKSSTSQMNIFPEESYTIMRITPPVPLPPIVNASVGNVIKGVQKSDSNNTQPFTLSLLPSSPKKQSNSFSSTPTITSPAPPPMPNTKSQAPPPPPPPPPPSSTRKSPAPPPLPKAGGFNTKSQAPPPPPRPPPPSSTRKSPAPPPLPKAGGFF